MTERLLGKEALRQLPFVDVVLEQTAALAVLTERTRRAAAANMDDFIAHLDPKSSGYSHMRSEASEFRNMIEKTVKPGGFSFPPDELEYVYSQMGRMTFSKVMGFFVREVFPQKFNSEMEHGVGIRQAGNTCLGYILDLLRIQKPDIASFDDGVAVLIDAMRGKPEALGPFMLGSMVDDSLHLRGTKKLPFDFLTSREEVEHLRVVYLRLANDAERRDFQRGFNISYEDLHIGATGFSTS